MDFNKEKEEQTAGGGDELPQKSQKYYQIEEDQEW